MLLRLVVACVFGIVVAGLALRAGWDAAEGPSSALRLRQRVTLAALASINEDITAFRREKHSLPLDLSQLRVVKDNGLRIEKDGTILDGWGRPFLYTVHGSHYRVISYGLDGRPGGTGPDADMISDDLRLPGPSLSLHSFLKAPTTRDAVQVAIVSGIVAGVLCFVTLRPAALTGRARLWLALRLMATLLAAIFVATIITGLHVVSGH